MLLISNRASRCQSARILTYKESEQWLQAIWSRYPNLPTPEESPAPANATRVGEQ
jgi:hypothetical protein